jgi:hypothetical protein
MVEETRTLTIICTNFAPPGVEVSPPILGFDKRPSRLKKEREIAAVTA